MKFSPGGGRGKLQEVVLGHAGKQPLLCLFAGWRGTGGRGMSWSGLSPGGAAGGSGEGPPRSAEDNPPPSKPNGKSLYWQEIASRKAELAIRAGDHFLRTK